jgi:hypothetical protein
MIVKTTPLQKKIAALQVQKHKIKELVPQIDGKKFKKIQILECIVAPYYKGSRVFDMSDPEQYDETYLVEKMMRLYNLNLKKTEGKHSDDICKVTGTMSDTKTSSFNKNHVKARPNSHTGSVAGVRSRGGKLKNGALRVVITNPFSSTPDYFYLPKNVWRKWPIQGPKNSSGRGQPEGWISYNYNSKTGRIPKFEKYRVGSFAELANKTD